jgi:hypothetical protein
MPEVGFVQEQHSSGSCSKARASARPLLHALAVGFHTIISPIA